MAPGTDQATAESTLRAAVDKLTGEVGRIHPEFQNLVDKIDGALRAAAFVSPVGAWLFSQNVSGKVAWLQGKLAEFVDEIGEFLEAATPVFSLLQTGFRWSERVLPELSGMVGTARDIRPNALHAWGGDAGRTYMEKRWGQRDGLQGATNVVKDTGQWLIDVAALNAKFLVDITQPVIDLIEAIVEAAIELATVVGILEAIDTVAAAAADTVGAILELVKEATKHTYDSLSKLNEARIVLNNNDAFPNGKWPQAVNR